MKSTKGFCVLAMSIIRPVCFFRLHNNNCWIKQLLLDKNLLSSKNAFSALQFTLQDIVSVFYLIEDVYFKCCIVANQS